MPLLIRIANALVSEFQQWDDAAVTVRPRVSRVRMRARAAVALLLGLSLAAVIAGFLGLQLYVHAYHRSPWHTAPTQLSACGRHYIYPQPHAQSFKTVTTAEGASIHKVGSTSGWLRTRAIWGRRAAEGSAGGCPEVWLQVGADRFIEYGLSGGL